MAQIFISHSSQDEGLVNKFHDLLQTGLGIHGTDTTFISSVPGRDVDMGNVHEHITKELVDAKLVIFILSSNFLDSRYCWAEVGAAFASARNTLLLAIPPNTKDDIKVMFEGYKVEQLATKRALNKLHGVIDKLGIERTDQGPERWEPKREEFIEWFKSDYEAETSSQLQRIEELAEWRDRGHWSESIVDGTIYIGRGYANMDVKKEILRTIRRGHVLPTIYAYLTNAGYHNWLRLTEDPTYQYYKDSLSLFSEHDEALAREIKSAVGRDEIDLISLGPGDGKKDVVMLKALAKVFKASDLYYYPFDVNPSMISHAMTATRGVRPSLEDIQVKAILADFDSLPEFSGIYQYRKAPNVLSLLGNTLGNQPEDRGFLEQVYDQAMSVGDLLLLEVRRVSESNLLTEANKEFDFGPLELLGIKFDPKKLRYKTETTERYRSVPNSKTIMAIYEKMHYEKKDHKNVKLALIREYDPGALEATCKEIGFSVLDRDKNRSAAYLLLQK
jgi:Histidine-specific methyltransferase, SAM-dependent/TIR domain